MAKKEKKASKKNKKKDVKRALKKGPGKVAKKVTKKVAKKVAKKSAPKKSARRAPVQKGKRFLIIYHAPADAMAQTSSMTPEEQAAGMAMWKTWAKRVGSKLTDLGSPLVNGTRLHPNGSTTPGTNNVAGYSLIQAADWEDLMDLLSGHPHISGWHPEATIEIHETMLLPGM